MVTILDLAGMRTVHCVRAVFTALGGVPGVERADVTMGRAVVEHDRQTTPAEMEAAISPLGYSVVRSERSRALPTME
jgi:copper chaperone CopZ